MALLKHIGPLVFIALLAVNTVGEQAANQPAVEWLRGSGKDLEICLKGEVFEADGRPASDIQVTGRMNAEGSSKQFAPSVEGNQFKIWFPANQRRWYSGWLSAKSADGQRVAYKTLNSYALRVAAIDGIKLTLQSPSRQVTVKVTDQGRPVAGAKVKGELGFGIELQSNTNAQGIARLGLLPRQEMSHLTAWTDDHRIGGFSFNRSPPRDPNADEYDVELSKCRDQKIRFVDENGAPVPDVDFVLQVATPPPNYNFIGTIDQSRMTTNAAGEALFQWFPDWEKVHYYAEVKSGGWILDEDGDGEKHKTVEGVTIFKLKKGKPRKRVEGRVVATGTPPAGFFAEIRSFQGEREHYSDRLSAFADADGKFAVDVLPDARYCAFVLDTRYVGKIIDLIPYESATDKLNPLELLVSEGQEVEVTVTTGPKKKPYPNLTVSFRRNHEYSWKEDGEKRNGVSGPQWWTTTDDSGKAITRTLPGKMSASTRTPRWGTEKEITVAGSEPVKIELHREINQKRSITGRLVLDQGVTANLADAEVKIGSVDGNYEDKQESVCGNDGSFAFDTFAAELGVFGRTKDGRAAGSIIVKDLASPIVIHLHPTTDYEGQLLGENDQPVVGHSVQAIVRVEGKRNTGSPFPIHFEAQRIEAKTDERGNFTLPALPCEIKVNLRTTAVGDSSRSVSLDEVYLDINESRPRTISRMAKNAAKTTKLPLAERYKSTLRDCVLNGYRPMLVIANESEEATAFVDKNYLDYAANKDVYPFMQIVVSVGKNALDAADVAFLEQHDWQVPKDNHILAYAIDSDGKELGRLDTDIRHPDAPALVTSFIHQHAPKANDAEEKWNAAFAEANKSNRRVWARVSSRYCGPCFRLTRWLDKHHKLLEKDYVMFKVDSGRDENGTSVAERITRGGQFGVPFHVIYDQAGKLLVTSEGPLGNIGHPTGIDGKKQIRRMLLETRQNLTDAEIDQLVESIED